MPPVPPKSQEQRQRPPIAQQWAQKQRQRPPIAQQWAQEAKVKNQGSGRRKMLEKFARKQRG